METSSTADLTIDELAAATRTTTRRIRSFQTLGLLPHPDMRGRTGVYGPDHCARLTAILRLQGRGFSLESLGVLFRALQAGRSLAAVLGVPGREAATGDAGADPTADTAADTAELYGFVDLRGRGRGRPLLSVVPTTVWDENEAS